MGRRIVITGASGTVGRAAGEYLCGEGHEVVGVSYESADDNCYTKRVGMDLLAEDAEQRLEGMLENADAVFHLAWDLSRENFDNDSSWEGNMEMFKTVLDAARKAEVPVFINGSSIHAGTGSIPAYAAEKDLDATPEPHRSSIDPRSEFQLRREQPGKLLSPLEDDPDSPYGESKVRTEHMLKEAVRNGDFRLGVSIRIGGVNDEDSRNVEEEPYYSSIYWSRKDVGRTIEDIIESDLDEKNGYHQFYGISDNEGRIFSIENQFVGES